MVAERPSAASLGHAMFSSAGNPIPPPGLTQSVGGPATGGVGWYRSITPAYALCSTVEAEQQLRAEVHQTNDDFMKGAQGVGFTTEQAGWITEYLEARDREFAKLTDKLFKLEEMAVHMDVGRTEEHGEGICSYVDGCKFAHVSQLGPARGGAKSSDAENSESCDEVPEQADSEGCGENSSGEGPRYSRFSPRSFGGFELPTPPV